MMERTHELETSKLEDERRGLPDVIRSMEAWQRSSIENCQVVALGLTAFMIRLSALDQ